MRKINDKNLYFYFAIVTLVLALITGGISFYSILGVEPEVKNLLAEKTDIGESYKKAYLMVREPQLFAKYENFDAKGIAVKKSIIYFDRKIYSGEEIAPADKWYLQSLLDRRIMGSRLGRTTMFFLLLLSVISWGLYGYERRTAVS